MVAAARNSGHADAPCGSLDRTSGNAARTKQREGGDYASSLMMPAGMFKEAIRSETWRRLSSLDQRAGSKLQGQRTCDDDLLCQHFGEPVVLMLAGMEADKDHRWSVPRWGITSIFVAKPGLGRRQRRQ